MSPLSPRDAAGVLVDVVLSMMWAADVTVGAPTAGEVVLMGCTVFSPLFLKIRGSLRMLLGAKA